jgi:F0F1-type ATP synthase membrane subunit b/b'
MWFDPEIYILISFVIFVGVGLRRFGSVGMALLDGKIQTIHHSLTDAETQRTAALEALQTTKARLTTLDEHIDTLTRQGQVRADHLAQQMREQTTVLIQHKQADYAASLQSLQNRLDHTLYDYVVDQIHARLTHRLTHELVPETANRFTTHALETLAQEKR